MSKLKGYAQISQLVTLQGVHDKDGRRPKKEDLSIISNGAVVFDDNQILWVGSSDDIPTKYINIKWESLKDHCVLPELVDSHTHLVFGGNRAAEYSMRLNGATYAEIAQAGGGIISTMKMTNEASTDELFKSACQRIKQINSYGIGTIEIKSGYGLNIEKEVEVSLIIDRLKKEFAPEIQIFNTFMAAHAVPKEYSSARVYIDSVVIPALDKVHSEVQIDAVDIFHEEGYFSSEDTIYLFDYCRQKGLALKSHADEFKDNQGAALAAKYDCLSTDHLLCTSQEGIEALANSNTVATILPGTGFFLGKPQSDARSMIDSGVKLSIASDYNPGSCHCDNLILIASIAAPNLKLSQAELWCGITYNAAAALGLKNQGAITVGMKPRFSIFKVSSIDEITYNWGKNFAVV